MRFLSYFPPSLAVRLAAGRLSLARHASHLGFRNDRLLSRHAVAGSGASSAVAVAVRVFATTR
jgi:hypothetical protein